MDRYSSLLSRVRQVRRKWRLQMAVKGLSLFLTFAIALLLFGVWGADLFGFRPTAVWAFRALTVAAMLLVVARFLYFPVRRRISDLQIAQFIEERYPQLEDRLVSAVEFGQDPRMSPGMLNLLITDSLDKTSRLDLSVFLNRKRLLSYGILGAGAFAVLLVLLNWGPSFFPYGFNQLYVPWTHASIGAPVMIQVLPGNAEVARGSDQQVKAQLVGFDAPAVRLYVQPEAAPSWMPLGMEPEVRGSGFAYLLIDLQSSTRYYVEAKGVRSPTYAFKVIDIPKVGKIDLLYNFPAYTGMAPQKVENEGDISALKGTRVDLMVQLNQPARSARLVFDDQTTLDLVPNGGKGFSGTLMLKKSGSYVVDVEDASGKHRAASSEFEIEALDDEPPKVTIEKPMRDVRATNVEEVFSQLRAEDDIGMGKLELHYSVNGGPEKSVNLYNGKPSEKEVTAAHTFFLEEFGLQPGDVVSYYGRAWDNNNVTGPGTSSSDMYFIEVRPFEQTYRQSQQAGGGGGAGGAGDSADALSSQQKEIISATFKLIREQATMASKEYQDGLNALALVQSRLQAQTKGLIDRLERRGAAQISEDFGKLVEYLKNAVSEMEKGAVQLGAQKPAEALPAEEKALQQLMRAESLFRDIQVSFGGGNSAVGRGAQERAKDLADLADLEMDKLKSQYETVQRGEQQARDEKLDEALQKLKELARRLQQQDEKTRSAGGPRGSSSSGGGGGESQARLTQELQELQRQLQRLSRERSSPELNQASSQIQRAIDELRKSIDRSGTGQEAGAQGIRALQQLDEARRALERGQNAGLQRGLEDAVNESRKMVEEQGKIQEGIDRLAQQQQKQQDRGADAQQLSKDLADRKSVLADRVKGLAGTIDQLARQARKDQKETYNKLNEAAGTIRDQRLPERILSGNQLLNGVYYEFLKGREDSVRASLEDLNKQLEAAKSAIGQSKEAKLEENLRRARQLAQSLDSAQKRLQNSGPRQGQSGQPETGSQGQRGEQAQAGQRGQQSGQGQQARGGNPQDSQGRGQPNPAGGRPTEQAGEPSLGGSGPPRGSDRYNADEARQIQRQLAQGLVDAEELRRSLERNSSDARNLGRVVDELRNMNQRDPRAYYDPEQLARLKQSIDLLHQVELDLSRESDRLTEKDKYFYAEDSETPAKYKRLVEEYYKALARIKP